MRKQLARPFLEQIMDDHLNHLPTKPRESRLLNDDSLGEASVEGHWHCPKNLPQRGKFSSKVTTFGQTRRSGTRGSIVRNIFACAGPHWESVYLQRVKRNAHIRVKWQQDLLPINYSLPVASLELGDLTGCEITLCAPATSENFQQTVAEILLKAGASMVAAVSDVGQICIYRGWV